MKNYLIITSMKFTRSGKYMYKPCPQGQILNAEINAQCHKVSHKSHSHFIGPSSWVFLSEVPHNVQSKHLQRPSFVGQSGLGRSLAYAQPP